MKEWILSVVLVAFMSFLLKILLPEGKMQKVVAYILSVASILIIISPLKNFIKCNNIDIPSFNYNENYSEYYTKYREDYYINIVKNKLEENKITIKSCEILFDEDKKLQPIKNIKVILENHAINQDMEHINISLKIKEILSDLFNLPKYNIIVEKESVNG